MSSFASSQAAYPDAVLAFLPSVPTGSETYPGDFKVAVGGPTAIDSALMQRHADHWPIETWRRFALRLGLTKVQNANAAIDQQLAADELLLHSYGTEFKRTYGPIAAGLIPLPCIIDGAASQSPDVVALGAAGTSLLVRGHSGCGKTLVTFAAGLETLERGRVPIVVQAKHFAGNFRDTVNMEATLLGAPSALALLSACRRLQRPITLLLDGYNECGDARRTSLTRSVAAMARRYGASIIVSSQIELERSELLELQAVHIPSPDVDTKTRIATQAAQSGAIHELAVPLLFAVSSGLEARLIGEIGSQFVGEPGRYQIYDTYARRRLQADATSGISALSKIAGHLSDRITFGLTVRELDRIAENAGIAPQLLMRLQEVRFLQVRGDRVSFDHELLLDAFTAESVVRRANGDAARILGVLRAPVHKNHRDLIVGAIENEAVQNEVLSKIEDPHLLSACLNGLGGAYPRAWANRRSKQLIARARDEIGQLSFELAIDAWQQVRPVPSSLSEWSNADRALLVAIAERSLYDGRYLDDVLGLISLSDRKLETEASRLRDEARQRNIGIRHALFAANYTHANESGVSILAGQFNVLMPSRDTETIAKRVHDIISDRTLSAGELYILLHIHRHSALFRSSLGHLMPELFERHWARATSYLRAELMHAASFCANDPEPIRIAICDAINDLPQTQDLLVSTAMIEALQRLGGLEQESQVHVQVVASEIAEILAARDQPAFQAAAYGVWSAQFDHPYDDAYCEAVGNLPDDDRKALLFAAALGAPENSLFVGPLIKDLAVFNDPSAAMPIERWLALPDKSTPMQQDGIGDYLTAHVALAKLKRPLPAATETPLSDVDATMVACGQIIYWLNREDLLVDQRKIECRLAITILQRPDLLIAGSVLSDMQNARFLWTEGLSRLPGSERAITSIGDVFESEVAAILRRTIARPAEIQGYFNHTDVRRCLHYAVAELGKLGDESDLVTLRELSQDPALGQTAIEAVRVLEQRSR